MKYYFTILLLLLFSIGCKKEDSTENDRSMEEVGQFVLTHFADRIALQTYSDMNEQMNELRIACNDFQTASTEANLEKARKAWKDVRSIWEQSEAFLFGPVSTENIDPGMDTWPVDFHSMDSLLQTSNTFDQAYLNILGDELKGFHPTEYLLWGENGNKSAAAFTQREKEYLAALAEDLRMKASSLYSFWQPATPGNYHDHMTKAGTSASVYASQKAAFEEMVLSMAGICEEVANGKLLEPFAAQDPSLEESPFSGNSLTDFRNNIQGVKNIYEGKYKVDGYGIEDLVKKNNLSLNASIHAKLNNALFSFNLITDPFGTAIITQRSQIQQSIDAINELKKVLEEDLLNYIRIHTK